MDVDSLQQRLIREGSMTVGIRCRPGARQSGLGPALEDGTLKASVRAPAEGGKANAELLTLLEESFRAQAELVAGAADRRKVVRLTLRP